MFLRKELPNVQDFTTIFYIFIGKSTKQGNYVEKCFLFQLAQRHFY